MVIPIKKKNRHYEYCQKPYYIKRQVGNTIDIWDTQNLKGFQHYFKS